MEHSKIKENLLQFRDPELDETLRREIAEHLPTCTDCQSELQRWDAFAGGLRGVPPVAPSENFIFKVMNSIEENEEPAAEVAPTRRWPFLKWLLPSLGYGFALILMMAAITQREVMPTDTGSVLLADMPQSAQWSFSSDPAEANVNNLFNAVREESWK